MTESEDASGATADQEPPEPDEDPGVPNGEEEIDELGRNATQQRMVDRGEPPVE
jgi:hypothetical protein